MIEISTVRGGVNERSDNNSRDGFLAGGNVM